MTLPKLPVFSSGNPTYDSNGPVLAATGADLARETTFIQTAASQAAAIKRRDGNGIRAMVIGDSQSGNAGDRFMGAFAKTTPFTFDAQATSTGGAGPLQTDGSVDMYQEYEGGQWSNKTESIGASEDIEDAYTRLGLTTDADIQKYVPNSFSYYKADSSASRLLITQFHRKWTHFYDEDNFGSSSGVKIRFRFLILDNGSNLPSQYRMRVLYHPTTSSNANSYTSNLNFSAANRYNMGDGNYLTELVSNVVTHYNRTPLSSYSIYPSCLLYAASSGNMNDAETILYGAICERVDGSDDPIMSGMSIRGLMTASGRNPEVFLGDTSGRVTGLATGRTQHGSEQHIRQALYDFFDNPNHIISIFGHNAPTRTYASSDYWGAASAWQRDYFDLCYQIAEDRKAVSGEYPTFELPIMWEASNMDANRRMEVIGVANAMNRLGIPTICPDLYTYHGDNASNTHISTDSLHPNDDAAAQALWSPLVSLISDIADLPITSSNRPRDRSRER